MITGICRYSLWSKRKNKRCLLNSPAWKTWMDGSTISWELFCLPSSERILCTIIIMSYKNEMGNYLNTKKDKRFILESWVLSLLIPYTDWTAVQQFIFIVPVLYIISSVRLSLWKGSFFLADMLPWSLIFAEHFSIHLTNIWKPTIYDRHCFSAGR